MRQGAFRVPVRAAPSSAGGPRLSAVTGVVLAGGRATRFGADKLAADVRGIPLLHHALIRAAETCEDVVVVLAPGTAAPALPPGIVVRLATDAQEGAGPLAGLAAGLEEVATPLALVLAGDMPDVSSTVLREMVRVADEPGVAGAALSDGNRVRPLPCVVRVPAARSRARALLRSSVASERSLRRLLDLLGVEVIDDVSWRALDPSGGTLRDVDTRADLDAVRRVDPGPR